MPDLLTMAKGLASGLPIGAVVTTPARRRRVSRSATSAAPSGADRCRARPRSRRSTSSRRRGCIGNAIAVGAEIRRGALALGVGRVSGRGLLLGLHLGQPAVPVQRALFERRVLTGTASDPEVLRLMPPLSFSSDEARRLLDALGEVLE